MPPPITATGYRCQRCAQLWDAYRAADRWVKRLTDSDSPLLWSATHWRRVRLLDLVAHGEHCPQTVHVCSCSQDFQNASALRKHRQKCAAHRAMLVADTVPLRNQRCENIGRKRREAENNPNEC